MPSNLLELASRLEAAGNALLEANAPDRRRDLLAGAGAMADAETSTALPLFLRNAVKDAARDAHRAALAAEAANAADLASAVADLHAALRELRRAVADGRA
jgi:multidrug resistance efflux pump